MKNKFTEILTLSESDLFSHHRSKSSSQFTSMNSPKNYKKNYYLIEKKNANLTSNDSNIKSTKNHEMNEMSPNASQKYSNEFKNRKSNSYNYDNFNEDLLDKEESVNFSIYSNKGIKEVSPSIDKYLDLKEKYSILKSKYERIQMSEKHWRNSYFLLLQDSLSFDETIKNLMEENRIHQEYIISLENKLNKLFVTCNNITSNFHNSLSKNIYSNFNSNNDISFENTNNNVLNTNTGTNLSNMFMKNYNEILNDYKKQLEILSEEKESLHTNVSILRHQQLQTTIKMEDLQARLYNLEQARFEDLKVLQNTEK